MPEPSISAVVTIGAAAPTIAAISLLGIPLGLRADILMAGFTGSLVAIVLLNSVPGGDDTWRELVRTSARRMFVAAASAATSGYMTPLALLVFNVPEPLLLSMAFLVGSGAQKYLGRFLRYYSLDERAGGAA